MSRALVTGATGFIGYHVARVLTGKGFEVRALVREQSDSGCLKAIGAEPVTGDVRDHGTLKNAMKGCEHVYHAAADYRLWVPDPENMYATNVTGTINVMECALRSGVEKVVYTSTVGVLPMRMNGKLTDENARATLLDMVGHYKKSKFLAEQEVHRFAGRGLPVVIVNPTAPIGSMDRKPTPTGKMIVDYLNGRMPAYLDTGLNFVDVEDVAEGHWLAAQKGVAGERYILGNRNLTLEAFLRMLAGLTGRKPPRWRLPYGPVLCAAVIDEGLSRLSKARQPRIPLTAVRMARHYMFVDCSKAVSQFSLPQNSLENAAQKAIDWYTGNGYVKQGQRQRMKATRA
ncbi:MAG: 3 beta-hydroxysteroid dehydrogenase/Delta 5--_4-isomerase [Syntrophorhabdaceae bacterium PtaU1.Bin034]|nr:MAG: 3 beta-hydroxysteroid dehydrogenase/Delta 5-->4-isomerase [Syntrophorhabdaceae bacterium PtaU1.Bin034]